MPDERRLSRNGEIQANEGIGQSQNSIKTLKMQLWWNYMSLLNKHMFMHNAFRFGFSFQIYQPDEQLELVAYILVMTPLTS